MTPKLSQHVPIVDALACKLRACMHEGRERVLALLADDGYIPEVDDHLAPVQTFASRTPVALQFRNPRLHQLAFENQTTLEG